MELGKTIYLACGEQVRVNSQWAAQCGKRGTAVSSSAWEATAGNLSDETLVSPLATALLDEGGSGTLKNTATLANGEVLVRRWRIEIR